MIGNVIQSKFFNLLDYPGAAALSVHPDGRGPDPDRGLREVIGDGEADRMKFVRRHLLTAYAIAAFAYLLVPIAIVIAFSFNNPKGRYNYTWQGFTFRQWQNWDAVPGLRTRWCSRSRSRLWRRSSPRRSGR